MPIPCDIASQEWHDIPIVSIISLNWCSFTGIWHALCFVESDGFMEIWHRLYLIWNNSFVEMTWHARSLVKVIKLNGNDAVFVECYEYLFFILRTSVAFVSTYLQICNKMIKYQKSVIEDAAWLLRLSCSGLLRPTNFTKTAWIVSDFWVWATLLMGVKFSHMASFLRFWLNNHPTLLQSCRERLSKILWFFQIYFPFTCTLESTCILLS